MYLYHYFDKRSGPFHSITALPPEQRNLILAKIKSERPDSMCAKRDPEYIEKRINCEAILREKFIEKGGIVEIPSPHYMVVEHSPWLSTWFEDGDFLKISIRVNDGKEYRRQVYTYEEILQIIKKYGLPQDWNDDGAHGPERYIEAHVWTDDPISKFLK